MTDRERMARTYAKVRKKYPNLVNKEELDALAIRQEKQFSLLCCLGLAVGAAVCIALALYMESWPDTRYVILITGIFQVVEIVRILLKYPKIEKMYRPVETVSHLGTLTLDRIRKDGGKALRQAGNQFAVVRLPLYDKEDEVDVGIDNITSHIYRLHFHVGRYGPAALKVNKQTYTNATLGAMYYAVLTPQNVLAAAYQVSSWDLDPAVLPFCRQLDVPLF